MVYWRILEHFRLGKPGVSVRRNFHYIGFTALIESVKKGAIANVQFVSGPGQDFHSVSLGSIDQVQLGTAGALWQPKPFDHIIRSPEQLDYLQKYIADNPQKANLSPNNYLFRERPV